MTTNSANQTNDFIKKMEFDLSTLKEISRTYNSIPTVLENSDIRTRLIESFDYKKSLFFKEYIFKKSFQLDSLNKGLSEDFNQYITDYFGTIERAYTAPSFIDYVLTIA